MKKFIRVSKHFERHLSTTASKPYYPEASSLDFQFVDKIYLKDQSSKKRVIILGTYHGADSSADLVRQKIREHLPQICFVELCPERCSKKALLLTGYDDDDILLPRATLQSLDVSSPWKTTRKSASSAISLANLLKSTGASSKYPSLSAIGVTLESATRILRYIKFRMLTLNVPMLNVDMHVAIEEGAYIGSKIILGDGFISAATKRQQHLNSLAAERFKKYIANIEMCPENPEIASQTRERYYDEIEKIYSKTLITLRERLDCPYDQAVNNLEYSLFEKEINDIGNDNTSNYNANKNLGGILDDLHIMERKLIYYQVKFDERDSYMADAIAEAINKLDTKSNTGKASSIVAVVGASHVWGVCNNLIVRHKLSMESKSVAPFPNDLKELIQWQQRQLQLHQTQQ